MSIGKLAVGAEGYYLQEVLDGAEDYYVVPGEAPGRWLGDGAAALGLSGRVEPEPLRNVLAGLVPEGELLLRATRASVPGFDLTLSAPKSVSVLWALGDPAVGRQVVDCHERAVDAALGYLGEHGCWVRRGHAGAKVVPGDGFVGAVFRHRTSRAGDPALRSHVLVANVAAGPDGRWTALDARHLYREARTAGFVYQAVLRHELAVDLGVLFEDVAQGHAEIAGIPADLRREFSQRSRTIRHEMARRGLRSARGAQVVTLDTRESRGLTKTDADLRVDWALRAERFGVEIDRLPTFARSPQVDVDDAALALAVTESSATFERRDVVRAVAAASTQGATLADIEARTDAFVVSGQAIELDRSGLYTTPEILTLERRTVELASLPGPTPAAALEAVDRSVAERPSLTDDQAAVVRSITLSDRPVEVVVGHAGSGKTFSLDAARAAWEASGYQVLGCSLSARAAAELEAGSGIGSQTIDRLLNQIGGGRTQLDERTVVVVDEAGMAGTRRLAALVAEAREAAAKVVLVGDPAQLPEIEAGGLFRALADWVGAHELTTNLRQRNPEERQAVLDLRHGEIDAALERLQRIGNVVTADNADLLRDGLVADWHAHHQAAESALMIAPRWSAVDDLNQRAQDLLLDSGSLGAPVASVGDVTFHAGDRVLALRNDYRHGLINGQLATVVDRRGDGLSVRLDGGDTLTVPHEYLDAGHLTLGYATTVHKAQGVTCDHNLVLGDDTYSRESGYSALTRGRLSNRTYLVAPDPPDHSPPSAQAAALEVDPLDLFAAGLRRSAAKTAAIDHTPTLEL